MSTARTHKPTEPATVAHLRQREEILQICFWYEGEGFGRVFSTQALQPFLNSEAEQTQAALEELRSRGRLEAVDGGYRFTELGRREGGRLFAEDFADFQRPAHGECEDGCCEEDDHSRCSDDCAFH